MHFQNHYTSNSNIAKRYRVLTMLEEGYFTIAQAAEELRLSTRQVKRLSKKFRQAGCTVESLVFKSHQPWNKKGAKIRIEAIRLKKENPARSNQFIAEKISQSLGAIHHSSVRRILIEANYYKKSNRKITPAKRFETQAFGEIVQMDTCEGYWLESCEKLNLILLLDDHSRYVVAAKIVEHDTSWNNMLVIREMISKYGLSKMIYTDNDSKFKVIRYQDIPPWHPNPKIYQTEIQRLCLDLGIALVSHQPFNPRAKGKIERFFRFIQDRFFPEHTAKDLEELNQQLQTWLGWYNRQHVNSTTGQQPVKRLKPSVFRKLPINANLDNYFCFKETRIVFKDNAFSLNGKRYYIDLKHNLAGHKVEIRITDTKVRIFYRDKFIQELPR